jgi:hypothetical protein
VTRHRYRPRSWRWWPAAALGALPHAGLAAALLVAGDWGRVVRAEVYGLAAALVLTLVLVCFRRSRAMAGGLLGATAFGLAAVVGVAFLR